MWNTIALYKNNQPVRTVQSFARSSITSAVINPAPTSGLNTSGQSNPLSLTNEVNLPSNANQMDNAAVFSSSSVPKKPALKRASRKKDVNIGVDNSEQALIESLQTQLSALMAKRNMVQAVENKTNKEVRASLPMPAAVGKINDQDLYTPAEISGLPNLVGQVAETPDQRSVYAQAQERKYTTKDQIRNMGNEVNILPYGGADNAVPTSNTPFQAQNLAVNRQLPSKQGDALEIANDVYDENAAQKFRSIFKKVKG
jgi:hypothetical protein